MTEALWNNALQLFAAGVGFGFMFALFLGLLLAVVAQVRRAVGWD